MSLGADYIADHEFERDYPFGLPSNKWKSNHGEIALKDMSESHIRNCMRIVGEDDAWYGWFVQELRRRGKRV